MRRFRLASASTIVLAALFAAAPARADDDKDKAKAEPLPDSITTALPIFADIATYRQQLYDRRGVQYLFTYITDIQSNVSGGFRRGAVYEGRLETKLQIDLGKFVGWQGGTVYFNAYAIHGRGLTRYNIQNILTTSEIEALPTVRLSEFWYEHTFNDYVAIKAGQLAADIEFNTRNFGGPFVNSTFGWPASASANLPGGGPAYPFASPGVRVMIKPTGKDDVVFRAAVFDGDPAGPGPDDPQRRNMFGTNFRLRDPPLFIAEGEFHYGSTKDGSVLPGSVKLGAWNHFGRFDDLRLSADGRSTADPSSSGIALRRRGNDGIYAVVEQMIYAVPETEEKDKKGISVFARASGNPADRSLIDFYADAGVSFNGILPSRPDDSFGIAGAYAHISGNAALLDQEKAFFTGVPNPIRKYEGLFEASYQAQVMTGWTVQPDFQYIFRPGGGIPDPNDLTGIRRVQNAVVVGVRSTVKF